MSFQPRPYQEEALDAIQAAYRRGVKRALMVLPTGCGKTQVFCWLIERRRAEGDRRPALIVAHREELLTQAYARVRDIMPNVPVSIERAEQKASPGSAIVIASVQTVGRASTKRLGWLEPGLIIIDECHHTAAAGYGHMLKRFAGGQTDVLGVTATPKRLDKQALHGAHGAVFEEVVYSYPIRQAILDGYLVDIKGYRVDGGADLSGVKTTGGDFAAGELARKVDAPERTDAALKHWREVAGDRRTIAFCASVEHAHHVAEAFREAGVTAEAVDGGMGRETRAAIMERFRRGQSQVLTNCEIATEGFDVPEASCVLLLRPTQSWALYVQMVGRGTRLAPGKNDLVVIDVMDNCTRHSLASVPAILDLPPNLDLQGQSLIQAARALDEMGAKAAVLQKVLPANWTELQTLLQSVDLFAAIEPAPELEGSRLAWLASLGGYQIDCGNGRRARLEEDALGTWTLTLTKLDPDTRQRRLLWRQAVGPTIAVAARHGGDKVLEWWPDAGALVARDARWRVDPPTDKQRAFLRRLGQPDTVIAQLSKGQASGLIDQLMARPRSGAQSRL